MAKYEFERIDLAKKERGDTPHKYDVAMRTAVAEYLNHMVGDLNQLCCLPDAANPQVDVDAWVARLPIIAPGADPRTARMAARAAHPKGLTGAALAIKLMATRYVLRVETPLEWAQFVASRGHLGGSLDEYEQPAFFSWIGRELRALVADAVGSEWSVPLGVMDFDGIDWGNRGTRLRRGGRDLEALADGTVLDLRRDRDMAQAFASFIVSRADRPRKPGQRGDLDLIRAWNLLNDYSRTGDPAVFDAIDDYTGRSDTTPAQKKARRRLIFAARELARRALERGDTSGQRDTPISLAEVSNMPTLPAPEWPGSTWVHLDAIGVCWCCPWEGPGFG